MSDTKTLSNQEIQLKAALQAVKDPVIPSISVVELGIITDLEFDEKTCHALVIMTPTFTGCPAIDYMRKEIEQTINELEFVKTSKVKVDFSTPWSSNLISPEGLKKIEEFGLAAPKRHCGQIGLKEIDKVSCPVCKSENTTLNNLFGPTLCRSVHLCQACGESFEAFKPL